MAYWVTLGCSPCFWSAARNHLLLPFWKETMQPPLRGWLGWGLQEGVSADLEIAWFSGLVDFPRLYKPHQIWVPYINIAVLYPLLATVDSRSQIPLQIGLMASILVTTLTRHGTGSTAVQGSLHPCPLSRAPSGRALITQAISCHPVTTWKWNGRLTEANN